MFRPLFRAGVGVPSAFSAQARSFSSTGAAAAALARINLVGNLGSAPELVNTSTGRELVRYTVGVTSGPRHDRRTSWFRVASFVPEGATRDYLLGVPKGYGFFLVSPFETVWEYADSMRVQVAGFCRGRCVNAPIRRQRGPPWHLIQHCAASVSLFPPSLFILKLWLTDIGSIDVLRRPRPKDSENDQSGQW